MRAKSPSVLKALGIASFGLVLSIAVLGGKAQARIDVPLDRTQTIDLPAAVKTVVLSNPSIADVTVEGPDRLLILGKSYGVTNMIGFNDKREAVLSTEIIVGTGIGLTAGDGITLNRGIGQTSFVCAPRCERALTPGDEKEAYADLVEQVSRRLELAGGTAQGNQ